MTTELDEPQLDIIFRNARSQNNWQNKPVSEAQLKAIYDVTKWGPTSANCFPMRLVFVVSAEQKERLASMVLEGNAEKILSAGASAIIGYDREFYEKLPQLFPHNLEAREWFANDPAVAEATAFRNGTLQGAYLMIAARALGLDCGPMSGFDNDAVDAAFFPGGKIRSNFLCSLGYGDGSGIFERSPRPDFDEVCQVL